MNRHQSFEIQSEIKRMRYSILMIVVKTGSASSSFSFSTYETTSRPSLHGNETRKI